MSFIILGDPHLGGSTSIGKSGIGTAYNSRIIDQVNLLDWVLDQAIQDNISNIIITGDIFEDPKPPSNLICLFIDWVQKCKINGIDVHAIRGNHDLLRTGNFYTSPLDVVEHAEISNFHLYKNINTLYLGTIAITMVPFRDRKSFICDSNTETLGLLQNAIEYELSSIPITYTKILIGHLAIEGSIPVGNEIDDLTNELFCPIEMFNGYDYVWMGHIHKHQVISKKPYISHIGSMDLSNFGESHTKKYIVKFDSENINFNLQEIPTRPLNKIMINIPSETKDTTQYVIDQLAIEDLKDSIVKLEISLASPELISVDRGKIEKYIYQHGASNISNFSQSKKVALIKKESGTVDLSLDTPAAINLWANKRYSEAEEAKKNKFVELSLKLLSEINAK